jgi:hypothetical protein
MTCEKMQVKMVSKVLVASGELPIAYRRHSMRKISRARDYRSSRFFASAPRKSNKMRCLNSG